MIDAKFYRLRKQLYQEKINAMTGYASNSSECRSTLIRKYFGDNKIEPCGICDHCIARKKINISDIQVSELAEKIIQVLPLVKNLVQLQQQLRIPMTHLEMALSYLEREERISWDENGNFALNS
jgi:ATP-dependent DNA helicase RecQ